MREYILLMHSDTASAESGSDWDAYIGRLHEAGCFRGGSVIGAGQSFRKDGLPGPVAAHISGFIRIEAADLEAARALLPGNPAFEAGGTVEIRELPITS